MWLSSLCVRRPVFTTMLIFSLVVLGLTSWKQMGVDLFPKVDLPTVTVRTVLQGASPEEMETRVTKPLEEAVNTVSGLDELHSSTQEGNSLIIATFFLDKNIDIAAQEVRDKVSGVLGSLPSDVQLPVVEKFDPDASPVLAIVVSGERSSREITYLVDKKVKQALEVVKDVGAVTMVGGRTRQIQVEVSSDRLHSYGLSVIDVRQALLDQNVEIPGGFLTKGETEKGLRTMGRLPTVAAFAKLTVASVKNAPVTLADIGKVVDGVEEPRTLSRLDGRPAVSLLIRKQSGTNTVEVVRKVKEKLEDIKKVLPPDLKIELIKDQSRFIQSSIQQLEEHLLIGSLLAALVVLLFMRSLTSTLIAALAIPVSLISTFTLMKYFGFTLNNMTMLALSISTGIVIDDAIVVLENIFRFVEEKGVPPMEAAVAATREIGLAVMATTLSLVVIFMPVAFMGGIIGRFFYSFGLGVIGAVITSLLVSFTLTPMLASRWIRKKEESKQTGSVLSKEKGIYPYLERGYQTLLRWALAHRAAVLVVAMFLIFSLKWLGPMVGFEFIKEDDNSEFEVSVLAPPGSSLDKTSSLIKAVEDQMKTLPAVTHVFTNIGVGASGDTVSVNTGTVHISLLPINQRKASQNDLMMEARTLLKKFPDLRTTVQMVNLIGGGGMRSTPFNMVLAGPDLDFLEKESKVIVGNMRKTPGFVDVDTTLPDRAPEVQVDIDRLKAADLGISAGTIANSLRIMVAGEKAGTFREGDDQYDVFLRLAQNDRRDPRDVINLGVPSSRAGLVPLSNIVKIHEGLSPSQIDHYNRERQITIGANLENLPLGAAIDKSDEIIRGLDLPVAYSHSYIGRGKIMGEMALNFILAFALAMIFIYIVLAAQFESYVHPFTIMLTSIPLSFPFAFISLIVTKNHLDIYSILGLFMLMGVVKKNAILQVDFAIKMRHEGLPSREAVFQASVIRLRPILMTTLAIVAGMLPIALGQGEGSASRSSLAIVVVGGQSLSLLITLLVTPVLYSVLDDFRQFKLFARIRTLFSRPGKK